jgi:hypothetical protein
MRECDLTARSIMGTAGVVGPLWEGNNSVVSYAGPWEWRVRIERCTG